LQRRPPTGIWGGLLSLPEVPISNNTREWCAEHLGLHIQEQQRWPVLRHSFSHFHLDISPVIATLNSPSGCVMEDGDWLWYNREQNKKVLTPSGGLPAPIARLLEQLN
jgi:A/G-specific adenine glycosylase